MRILGAVFFLSLLAGKFATFEQMLLTDQAFFKKWRMRITSARIFLKGFWWENVNPQNSRITNILFFDFGVWILALTGNILQRNALYLFCISVLICPHLDHTLSCWFEPRASGIFTSQSAKKKKKKERNHKLTNALEYKLCFLKQ